MTARLQRLVRPFLLRRTKQEVLSELPDKEEHILYFELEEKGKGALSGQCGERACEDRTAADTDAGYHCDPGAHHPSAAAVPGCPPGL